MIKYIALVSAVVAVLAGRVSAQSSDAVLTETLARQFAASNFPGFGVVVINNGKISYQHGFGYADVASKKPYTVDTVQPIGSVSKTFIGIALMKAIELGYFTLDTNINDVLDFKVSNPAFPSKQMTIRHLATHTSGIVDREEVYNQTYLFNKSVPDVSLKTFLVSYLTPKGKFYSKNNFAASAPGKSFHYSNIGATLAAYLIEAKTGMPFADFVQKHVLHPAHMNASGYYNTAKNAGCRATLYNPQNAPYPIYSSITYPDGSIRSSCADLSKYLVEIIKGYSGSPNLLLVKNSFRKMLKPQFSPQRMPSNISLREPNQGIFFAFRRDGSLGHTGSDYGVSAFLFFNPKTNIGKIFLTNVDIQESPKLAAQFAQIWKTLDNKKVLINTSAK